MRRVRHLSAVALSSLPGEQASPPTAQLRILARNGQPGAYRGHGRAGHQRRSSARYGAACAARGANAGGQSLWAGTKTGKSRGATVTSGTAPARHGCTASRATRRAMHRCDMLLPGAAVPLTALLPNERAHPCRTTISPVARPPRGVRQWSWRAGLHRAPRRDHDRSRLPESVPRGEGAGAYS